jgi:hypothetical protein
MAEKIDKYLEMKLIYASTEELLKLAEKYADKCGKLKVKL